MKFKPRTLEILKNLSTINNSIFIREGKELRTTVAGNQIFVIAQTEDLFPRSFAIFDLQRLLNTISLFKDPDIEFGEKFLTIKSGSSRVRYSYAAENMVTKADERSPIITPLAEFVLPPAVLSEALKAASVLGLPDITIVANDGEIFLTAHNKKEASSDNHLTTVGTVDPSLSFQIDVNIEKIKVMSMEYKVVIAKSKSGNPMVNLKNDEVSYFISAEATSKVN